jgi:hypothetical protein
MGEGDLDAGDFSSWLVEIQAALRAERAAEVPCGGCTACCTSSQFVHVGPDETDTLAHIPAELLFPAPRMPEGHVLLGYDERGHCPMLIGTVLHLRASPAGLSHVRLPSLPRGGCPPRRGRRQGTHRLAGGAMALQLPEPRRQDRPGRGPSGGEVPSWASRPPARVGRPNERDATRGAGDRDPRRVPGTRGTRPECGPRRSTPPERRSVGRAVVTTRRTGPHGRALRANGASIRNLRGLVALTGS